MRFLRLLEEKKKQQQQIIYFLSKESINELSLFQYFILKCFGDSICMLILSMNHTFEVIFFIIFLIFSIVKWFFAIFFDLVFHLL